jgi:methyltransferase (TIGR00027 family)
MLADRSSRTADHNALFRALEARRPPQVRVADDDLACRFLSPGFRCLAQAARLRPVGGVLERLIDLRWPCVRAGVVARTRLIDETIVDRLAGVDQALVLGAGFDTRPYRLEGMRAMPVFEVDHPSTQAAKQRGLRRRGGPTPGDVRFVAVRFGADDLAAALAEHGFRAGARTLVVWEGVTNYLDRAAVDAMFAFLATTLTSGSPVVFTYVDRRMLDATLSFDGASTTLTAVRRMGEPFTFGLDPRAVPGYLAERGFALNWDLSVHDVAPRYYPAADRPRTPAYYRVVSAERS